MPAHLRRLQLLQLLQFKAATAVAAVVALVIIDQISKAIIRAAIAPSQSVQLLGFLQIVHISNTGAVFGLLKGSYLYIAALSVPVAAFLLIIYRNFSQKPQKLGVILIVAGIVGNTIDRLTSGYVTDFIYVRPWPAFNLADSFLSIGAVLVLSTLLLSFVAAKTKKKNNRRREKKSR